jgi:hypothetical protein
MNRALFEEKNYQPDSQSAQYDDSSSSMSREISEQKRDMQDLEDEQLYEEDPDIKSPLSEDAAVFSPMITEY